jgi:putative ABC transport system permease protein
VGSRARLALWMLTGAVVCVLLIAAANVAGLSLARGAGRAREIAVRAALGASHARIVRQLLAESVTLAVIAGLLGSWLAAVSIRTVRALGMSDLPRSNEIGVDLQVLGWAFGISLVTGIAVGLAPAMTLLRRNLRPSAEDSRRNATR